MSHATTAPDRYNSDRAKQTGHILLGLFVRAAGLSVAGAGLLLAAAALF